jgi:hypothetical protein
VGERQAQRGFAEHYRGGGISRATLGLDRAQVPEPGRGPGRARSAGRRWSRSYPAATSACSMACREAPVEYWVSIWMSVTLTPFGPNCLQVSGMPYRWPERARFARVRLPPAAGQARRPSCGLSEALPAWGHQQGGCARVGGTHEWDRCTSLIGYFCLSVGSQNSGDRASCPGSGWEEGQRGDNDDCADDHGGHPGGRQVGIGRASGNSGGDPVERHPGWHAVPPLLFCCEFAPWQAVQCAC